MTTIDYGNAIRTLLLATIIPLSMLIILVRVFAADESRLMSDMRKFIPSSYNLNGKLHPDPDAVFWRYDRYQPKMVAQRPFRILLQMDEHSRNGGIFQVNATYPVTDKSVCMYFFLARDADTAPAPMMPIDLVVEANGVRKSVALDSIDRTKSIVMDSINASDSRAVDVSIALQSRGWRSPYKLADTRVAVDYLHFEGCEK